MNQPPPLGGIAPPFQCSRLLRWPDENSRCGKEATWHIIWTEDLENGLACDDHMEETKERWSYYAYHKYETVCSMPGALFLYKENICIFPEEDFLPDRELAQCLGS